MSRCAYALAAALVLASCGSSGSSEDEESRVRAIIREYATVRDASHCLELTTQRFLEQTEFRRGAQALEDCQEDAKTDEPARSVGITRVRVNGDRATARAAFRGGDEDGATGDFALVKRDGKWKLDRVTGVELEFERYLQAGRKGLARPPDPLKPKQVDCAIRKFRALGEEKVERAIVEGDAAVFVGPITGCLGGVRGLRAQIEKSVRESLGGRLPAGQIDCVVRTLRETVSDDLLLRAVVEGAGGALTGEIREQIRDAAEGCVQGRGEAA